MKSRFFEKVKPFLYLAPFIVGVTIFTLYPIVNVVKMSLMENYKYLTGDFTGYGFGNFKTVIEDQYFRQAMGNTLKYVAVVIPISTCLAVVIATLLNSIKKFQALLQTAYFLPMVTSVTAVGLAWRFMFNYKQGVINYVLSLFGVPAIDWLGATASNFSALCVYGIWAILPFTIILLVSGLQNIDPMYYTAAKVDGAKPLRIFFRITIPLLAPTIFLVLTVNCISCFKVYNELFPLFAGPGIAYNLFTVVYYIYYEFRVLTPAKYGLAAAAALMLFGVIFVVNMLKSFVEKKLSN
ncbi:MAG: sugar ABC transporter permease [Erysipelotrichaceae bacterium]|nr:sugar ABC transporter permease [Erysipelotrichaceae bacterium]